MTRLKRGVFTNHSERPCQKSFNKYKQTQQINFSQELRHYSGLQKQSHIKYIQIVAADVFEKVKGNAKK